MTVASASAPTWTSAVSGARKQAALKVACEVAERAVDRRRVAEALTAARRQAHHPDSVSWLPYSVAEGDAGLAVLCSYVDQCFPRSGWDTIGDDLLTAGLRAAERAGSSAGLFGGLSGLSFTASLSNGQGSGRQRLLAALDAELSSQVPLVAARLRSEQGVAAVGGYDVVTGASGVAAGLLARDPHERLPEVMSALVWLASPVPGAPRWATPPERLVGDAVRRTYPYGNLNCGLAHGIPGPLSVLASALLGGHEVPGQSQTVRHLADWLVEHRSDDGWGINWASAVPLSNDGRTPASGRCAPARSAWCYGAPGVAHALWLAGTALDDSDLRNFAIDAMSAVLSRPVSSRFIDSPTFCHGVAGLLQVVLRFAHATRLPFFLDAADELVGQLLAAYDPDRPLGYAALDPGNTPVDRPGLLDGATGVALVLLAAATDVDPIWDRLFLLS